MVASAEQPHEVITESTPEGQPLRHYIKGRFLGKGGFAKVYEFTEMNTGRVYAAKIIDKQLLVKPKTQAKLRSEIKIHSALKHKHVVQFERYFEDYNNVYILLELCTQQTLMELQRRKKQLSELEAQYIMLQTIDAVKHLHQRSIIHRDLKLGNLFLSENMDVKIGDFGLAAEVEYGERKRTLCGTPNYIAPEILDGKQGHSFEVDIWCLGVILYTLLVGRPPFETADVKSTYKRIRENAYSFPESLAISSQARHLIRRILQAQPENRPSLADIEADPFFHTAPADLLYNPPWSLFPSSHPQFQLQRAQADARRDPLRALPGPGPALHNTGAMPPPPTWEYRKAQVDSAKENQPNLPAAPLPYPQRAQAAPLALSPRGRLAADGRPFSPLGCRRSPACDAAPAGPPRRCLSVGPAGYAGRAAPHEPAAATQPAAHHPGAAPFVLRSPPHGVMHVAAAVLQPHIAATSPEPAPHPTFGYSTAAAATAAAPATPAPHSPGPFVAPAPRGRSAEAPPVMPAGPLATAPGPGPASQRGLRASAGGHYVDEMATNFKRHCHMESPASRAPEVLAGAGGAPVVADEDDEEDRGNLTEAHHQLEQSFMPQGAADVGPFSAPMAGLPGPRTWVTECADFSAKYGMAYKLGETRIGVRYNDSTHMVWDCQSGTAEYVCRVKENDHVQEARSRFSMADPPDCLAKKVTLIKYFRSYLQKPKGRKDGGTEVVVCSEKAPPEEDAVEAGEPYVYVKRWLKTKHALIFRLSNKSVQVCFFDKTEVILSSEERVVTYTGHNGERVTFALQSLAKPPPDVAKRLKYTKEILFQLIHH